MKFPYILVTDFPRHLKRARLLPWMRFGISNPKKKSEIIYPVALVDSGSDVTIVDYEIGEKLGYNIKKGIRDKVIGVGGGSIEIYWHIAIYHIHDGSNEKPITYEDRIAFAYKKFPISMPQQTAILGTIGFFRNLEVTFEHPEYIFVKPKK